jgi:S-adenosylmethionine hydrolase
MKPMENPPTIAIITDFGIDDPFVGVMKGIIAGIAPQVRIIDICHSIPQGDIQRAAVQLWMSKKYFPEKTIFLVVVDPGVGTERKAIVVEDGDYIFVGPDNGVFSFTIGSNSQSWELSNPDFQVAAGSSTFHGRDIFAPAAAYLANGIPAMQFGSPVERIIDQARPHLSLQPGQMSGEIIYADQFGNLLTSLGAFKTELRTQFRFEPWINSELGYTQLKDVDLASSKLLLPGDQNISWAATFADIPRTDCGFLVGSTGLIEIAANNQSAQDITNLSIGQGVTLLF